MELTGLEITSSGPSEEELRLVTKAREVLDEVTVGTERGTSVHRAIYLNERKAIWLDGFAELEAGDRSSIDYLDRHSKLMWVNERISEEAAM